MGRDLDGGVGSDRNDLGVHDLTDRAVRVRGHLPVGDDADQPPTPDDRQVPERAADSTEWVGSVVATERVMIDSTSMRASVSWAPAPAQVT
jgi:hypothetical protein